MNSAESMVGDWAALWADWLAAGWVDHLADKWELSWVVDLVDRSAARTAAAWVELKVGRLDDETVDP